MKEIVTAAVAAMLLCSLPPGTGGDGTPSASSPFFNMYVHQEGDDGTRPTAGTEAVMLFEPSGAAAVYVQSEDAHVAVPC